MLEFGKTGRFNYRHAPGHRDHGLCLAHRRRGSRARSAAGRCLRRHGHLDLRQAQARRAGNAHDGLLRRQRDARRLHHLAVQRGDPRSRIGARRVGREDGLFLGAVSQPAGLGRGDRDLRPAERELLRDIVRSSRLYAPRSWTCFTPRPSA